jgi:hypothetical protein
MHLGYVLFQWIANQLNVKAMARAERFRFARAMLKPIRGAI